MKETITKLSNTEIIRLRESGFSSNDIKEINTAIKKTTYHLVLPTGEKKEITASEAIDTLGRDEWVKGVARSTFYVETTRTGLSGEKVHIYSKTWLS